MLFTIADNAVVCSQPVNPCFGCHLRGDGGFIEGNVLIQRGDISHPPSTWSGLDYIFIILHFQIPYCRMPSSTWSRFHARNKPCFWTELLSTTTMLFHPLPLRIPPSRFPWSCEEVRFLNSILGIPNASARPSNLTSKINLFSFNSR